MTKTICTASVFATIMSLLFAGFYFDHAGTVWWGLSSPDMRVPIGAWIFMNIIGPIGFAYCGGFVLCGIWKFSGLICSKLRGGWVVGFVLAKPLNWAQRIIVGNLLSIISSSIFFWVTR